MKFKKFMALALAGVMTFAMTGTVFADDPDLDVPGETGAAAESVTTYDTFNALVQKTVIKNANVAMPEINFEFVFTPDADKTLPARATIPAISNVTISYNAQSANVQTGGFNAATVFANAVPGCYAYTITEAQNNAANWTAGGESYTLRVYKESSGSLYYTIQNAQNEKVGVADFKNTYIPKSSVSVSKAVDNPQWTDAKFFNFELTFSTTDQFIDLAATTVSVNNENKTLDQPITFALEKDGNITIDGIPAGISYKIKETSATTATGDVTTSNYDTTTIQIGTATATEGTEANDTVKETAANNAIAYTNKYKDIPVTGLALNIAPFIAMFAAVGAAIALYIAAKRRVR